MRSSIPLSLALVILSGCANVQLKHSTVKQASTLTELQYQQVLDNIAMIAANPSALPWHVNVTTGTAQVTDFGSATFALNFGRVPGHQALYLPGASAQRTVVETWGTSPVADDDNLKLLRMAYHNAFGWGETLSNNKDYANDLGHELAKQTQVSFEQSLSNTLLESEQIKRATEAVKTPGAAPTTADQFGASGPSIYLPADRNTVTTNDGCLECDLNEPQARPPTRS